MLGSKRDSLCLGSREVGLEMGFSYDDLKMMKLLGMVPLNKIFCKGCGYIDCYCGYNDHYRWRMQDGEMCPVCKGRDWDRAYTMRPEGVVMVWNHERIG